MHSLFDVQPIWSWCSTVAKSSSFSPHWSYRQQRQGWAALCVSINTHSLVWGRKWLPMMSHREEDELGEPAGNLRRRGLRPLRPKPLESAGTNYIFVCDWYMKQPQAPFILVAGSHFLAMQCALLLLGSAHWFIFWQAEQIRGTLWLMITNNCPNSLFEQT